MEHLFGSVLYKGATLYIYMLNFIHLGSLHLLKLSLPMGCKDLSGSIHDTT